MQKQTNLDNLNQNFKDQETAQTGLIAQSKLLGEQITTFTQQKEGIDGTIATNKQQLEQLIQQIQVLEEDIATNGDSD